jgi:hypothetical protein
MKMQKNDNKRMKATDAILSPDCLLCVCASLREKSCVINLQSETEERGLPQCFLPSAFCSST